MKNKYRSSLLIKEIKMKANKESRISNEFYINSATV